MNSAAVHALLQRRGNVVDWWHATAPDPSTINPAMGQPMASLGGPKLPVGTFGESYPDQPVKIRAFLSNKFTTAQMQLWGIVEPGDMMLDIAVPFQAEPGSGILQLPPDLLCVYNDGRFAQVTRIGVTMDAPQTITFDRFGFQCRLWLAKARAVPLVDQNRIFAFRVLITEFSM